MKMKHTHYEVHPKEENETQDMYYSYWSYSKYQGVYGEREAKDHAVELAQRNGKEFVAVKVVTTYTEL